MLSRSASWLVKKSHSSSCSYSSAIIKVGDEVSQIRTFTKQNVQQFCDIIGDTNPVHSNSEVAKSLNFKDILVPGLFLNGMISSLIGNHLPGPGSILVKQFLDFVNPCYINEKVEAKVWVVSIKKRFIDCNYECIVTDEGKTVMKGNALIYKPTPN